MLRLGRGVRLQFERVTNSHVLLFPEGLVDLNETAHAVLSRLPAERTALEAELRSAFQQESLDGLDAFLDEAHRARWIRSLPKKGE